MELLYRADVVEYRVRSEWVVKDSFIFFRVLFSLGCNDFLWGVIELGFERFGF